MTEKMVRMNKTKQLILAGSLLCLSIAGGYKRYLNVKAEAASSLLCGLESSVLSYPSDVFNDGKELKIELDCAALFVFSVEGEDDAEIIYLNGEMSLTENFLDEIKKERNIDSNDYDIYVGPKRDVEDLIDIFRTPPVAESNLNL